MNLFADRTLEFSESNIYNILGDRMRKRAAAGLPVWNLSVGTPDFPPASHIIEATTKAASDPENYKYALRDSDELKEAALHWYKNRYNVSLTSDEVMSVAGSQEGIAHIALALLNPGETLLAPNPGYPIFGIGPKLMGANVAYYELLPESGYLPDFAKIEATLDGSVRAMIVSYPCNPLGIVAPNGFFDELVAFARRNNIWIIHDNAYSDITFDGYVAGSFLAAAGAKDVGVEFNSLSKTYNLTGTRVSFLLGNAGIIKRFGAIRSQFDYGLCHIFQIAAVAALTGDQTYVAAQRLEYERRRDALTDSLASIGWRIKKAAGTMFVWAKLPDGFSDDAKFVMDLIDAAGVVLTPGSEFGSLGRGYVRIALTSPCDKIREAVAGIKGFIH